MKKKATIGICAAVLFIGLVCFGIWFLSGTGSADYYTQIDNSKMEEVHSRGGVVDFKGGLPYSYTLLAYDEKGKEKEVTFGTSKQLREGAFLRLAVMPVRGVLEWAEVSYEELPPMVQKRYTAD
ncbi:MAG: YxeA family protein [Angelakisella sp.]|jgi:uncharacterized protein (TIGR01655 family)|nr:YxeA family protein [Angelakisella sp.]MCI9530124.1 YxeA family protein [Angelakisella sp.]